MACSPIGSSLLEEGVREKSGYLQDLGNLVINNLCSLCLILFICEDADEKSDVKVLIQEFASWQVESLTNLLIHQL